MKNVKLTPGIFGRSAPPKDKTKRTCIKNNYERTDSKQY